MHERLGGFVSPDNPILGQAAKAVEVDQIQSPEIQGIIDSMLALARGEQQDGEKRRLVGLTATQLGVDLQIIVVDVGATEKRPSGNLEVRINSEIIWRSKRTKRWYEGCFSTGQVCGIVSRSSVIVVRAYTREGVPVVEKYRGYPARIFQHEDDHLKGILFPSHIINDNDLHLVGEGEFSKYRKRWRKWPKKYPREML